MKKESNNINQQFLNLVAEREGVMLSAEDLFKPKPEKPEFTPEILSDYLRNRRAKAKFNDITKQVDFEGFAGENKEFLSANITALLYSELQGKYKHCNLQTIDGYLNILVSREHYNPVLELLDRFKWDGKDRISELYELLHIPESDTLSRVLIRKWLIQCIALLHNDFKEPFGADGVLCLTGKQGIGKTSFFKKLALKPVFFKEGISIDFRDKDSYIRALSCWICELGELESSLKRDIEKLKAFITQSIDEYRKPYGRGDVRTLRRTSLCATCNSAEFLIDISGNRRFWTIPVEEIDLGRLKDFDTVQLWKQVQLILNEEGLQSFRLTSDEQKQLSQRNGNHEKKLKAQQEVEDILSLTDTPYYSVKYIYQTSTEFKMEFEKELRGYSAVDIGRALDKCGVFQEVKRIDGKQKRVRLLPKRIFQGDQ